MKKTTECVGKSVKDLLNAQLEKVKEDLLLSKDCDEYLYECGMLTKGYYERCSKAFDKTMSVVESLSNIQEPESGYLIICNQLRILDEKIEKNLKVSKFLIELS